MNKKIIIIVSVVLFNLIAGMTIILMMQKRKEITIDTLE
jgi:hypothetical protein